MTDLDLEELKRLDAARTPGPIRLMDGDPLSVDFHAAVYAPKMTGATPVTKLAANAALIVATVNSLSALIARVEELEAALKPFSDKAHYWLERDDIHGLDDDDECATEIRFGDFRAARAALGAKQ